MKHHAPGIRCRAVGIVAAATFVLLAPGCGIDTREVHVAAFADRAEPHPGGSVPTRPHPPDYFGTEYGDAEEHLAELPSEVAAPTF